VALEDFIPTVVYAKSFKLPTGRFRPFFDSNGVFYVEDLIASPELYRSLHLDSGKHLVNQSLSLGENNRYLDGRMGLKCRCSGMARCFAVNL